MMVEVPVTEMEEEPMEMPPERLADEVVGENLGTQDWLRWPEGDKEQQPQPPPEPQGEDQSVPDAGGIFLKPEESEESKEQCPVVARIRMQVMEAQKRSLKLEERSRSPGRSAEFLIQHTERMPRSCSQCRKPFSCSTSLRSHQGVDTAMPYQCEECGKVFAHLANLRVHERGHVGPKTSRCPTCKISFARSLSNLAEHRRTQRGTLEQKYTPCVKIEGTQVLFRVAKAEERPHQCPHCGESFEDESSLREHENTHRRRTT
ncbi:zinc finger protein 691-like isoform X2 [Lacerta agilis]|uniref:zinc finger protein 691-like isoform X2 n=1 Tax=Lacerta agilis TaxID=80427 RepID=UPI0014191427|nr:zinc finger protein 691-like isoform X2 [Lacerta agilis]